MQKKIFKTILSWHIFIVGLFFSQTQEIFASLWYVFKETEKRGISFLLAIQNKNHWCYKLLICEQTGKNGMVLQKQILKVVEAAKFEKSAFLPKFDNFCRLALFTMMLITPSIKETIFLHIFFFRRLSLICMPDLNIV